MLYDEDGKAYVEPCLLPDDEHLRRVVEDYGRMYAKCGKMERRIERLGETNSRISNYNFFLRKTVQDELKMLRELVRKFQSHGYDIPFKWKEKLLDFELVAYPAHVMGKKRVVDGNNDLMKELYLK